MSRFTTYDFLSEYERYGDVVEKFGEYDEILDCKVFRDNENDHIYVLWYNGTTFLAQTLYGIRYNNPYSYIEISGFPKVLASQYTFDMGKPIYNLQEFYDIIHPSYIADTTKGNLIRIYNGKSYYVSTVVVLRPGTNGSDRFEVHLKVSPFNFDHNPIYAGSTKIYRLQLSVDDAITLWNTSYTKPGDSAVSNEFLKLMDEEFEKYADQIEQFYDSMLLPNLAEYCNYRELNFNAQKYTNNTWNASKDWYLAVTASDNYDDTQKRNVVNYVSSYIIIIYFTIYHIIYFSLSYYNLYPSIFIYPPYLSLYI